MLNYRRQHPRWGFPRTASSIGRAGRGLDGYFGNPWTIEITGSRQEAIRQFAGSFLARLGEDPEYRRRIEGLRGKTLLCFCKPLPCHGDVIAALLNGEWVGYGLMPRG